MTKEVYKGERLTIREVDEGKARASWRKAIKRLPAQKVGPCHSKLDAFIKQLGNTGLIRNTEQFNKEGKLPNGKDFYALKPHVKIRAYGWFSTKYPRTFFISHYAYKNQNKLQKADENKVVSAWRTIEE